MRFGCRCVMGAGGTCRAVPSISAELSAGTAQGCTRPDTARSLLCAGWQHPEGRERGLGCGDRGGASAWPWVRQPQSPPRSSCAEPGCSRHGIGMVQRARMARSPPCAVPGIGTGIGGVTGQSRIRVLPAGLVGSSTP